MKLTTTLRSTIAQDIIDAMASGSASDPKIEIYDGSIPAQMGQSITDTLLAELNMSTVPATETDGVITLNAVTADTAANNTGTAGWARILDRDGGEAIYLTVTETGVGGDLELNTVSISVGGPVSITSGTITVGGA